MIGTHDDRPPAVAGRCSRRGARAVAAALVAGLAMAGVFGCGGDKDARFADRVPSAAFLYGEAEVRPDGETGEAISSLHERFPPLATALESLREGLLPGVDFARDIDPWLGEHAGVFLAASQEGDPEGSLLLESTDDERALAALSEAGFEPESEAAGVEILVRAADADDEEDGEARGEEPDADETGDSGPGEGGGDSGGPAAGPGGLLPRPSGPFAAAIDDGVVLAGSLDGVRGAIEARSGDRETVDPEGLRAVERVEDGEVAWAWLEPDPLLEAVGEGMLGLTGPQVEEVAGAILGSGDGPAGISVGLEGDTLTLDQTTRGTGSSGDAAELLGRLPAEAVLAVAVGTGGLEEAAARLFAAGFAEGARDQGLDPQAARQAFRDAYGADPVELIAAVRGVAVHLSGQTIMSADAGAAVQLESEERTGELLGAIAGLLRTETDLQVVEDEVGLQVFLPGLPFPLLAWRDGDLVLAGTSDVAARAAGGDGETLSGSGQIAGARERLGDDLEPAALADGEALQGLLQPVAAADEQLALIVGLLAPVTRVTVGERVGGDTGLRRVIVELGGGSG